MTSPSDKPIWEHQPDEPAIWYRRFCTYRDMGPERSLLQAYRRHRGKKLQSVSSTWYTHSARWRWDQRAVAFDDYHRGALQARELERRWDWREARLLKSRQIADRSHDKLLELLDSLDAETLAANFAQLRQLYRDALDLQRLEIGLRDDVTGSETPKVDDFVKMRDTFFALLGTNQLTVEQNQLGESEPTVLSRAAAILADLYPSPTDADRLAGDAGLDRRLLNLSGSAMQIWHGIVDLAHKNDRLLALTSVALREYPGNPALIDLLRHKQPKSPN